MKMTRNKMAPKLIGVEIPTTIPTTTEIYQS
jgi:hypothetical protein